MSESPLDPKRALEAAGVLLERAAEPAADWLAQTVRGMSNERLDWLMRTPVRKVVLEGIFWQMPAHLDRRKAAGVNSMIRWEVTGRADGKADVYDLVITDGRAHVERPGDRPSTGATTADRPRPQLTITVDAAEFLRIAAGSSNPVSAYFNGKLALRGDLMQAARLTMLFRIPTRKPKPKPGPAA